MNDLNDYLLDEKNKNINYKYFLEHEKIDPNIFDTLYDNGKITNDMLEDALKREKYYQNFSDIQIIKYKDYINISYLITKRTCSMNLIENLVDRFNQLDWDYLLKNYNNISNDFLIENKDKLLIFLYRNLKQNN